VKTLVVDNFLSEEECNNWIRARDLIISGDTSVDFPTDSIRDKLASQLQDYFKDTDFEGLVDIPSNMKVTRIPYNDEDYHIDWVLDYDGKNLGVCPCTCLIYLNTLKDGELFISTTNRKIEPVKGRLLIFPSWYTYPHKVQPYVGDRYLIRIYPSINTNLRSEDVEKLEENLCFLVRDGIKNVVLWDLSDRGYKELIEIESKFCLKIPPTDDIINTLNKVKTLPLIESIEIVHTEGSNEDFERCVINWIKHFEDNGVKLKLVNEFIVESV